MRVLQGWGFSLASSRCACPRRETAPKRGDAKLVYSWETPHQIRTHSCGVDVATLEQAMMRRTGNYAAHSCNAGRACLCVRGLQCNTRRDVLIKRPPTGVGDVMPGKRVQFDQETWNALDLLARDSMRDFQELADEAFADLLRKHGRPVDLRGHLQGTNIGRNTRLFRAGRRSWKPFGLRPNARGGRLCA